MIAVYFALLLGSVQYLQTDELLCCEELSLPGCRRPQGELPVGGEPEPLDQPGPPPEAGGSAHALHRRRHEVPVARDDRCPVPVRAASADAGP